MDVVFSWKNELYVIRCNYKTVKLYFVNKKIVNPHISLTKKIVRGMGRSFNSVAVGELYARCAHWFRKQRGGKVKDM